MITIMITIIITIISKLITITSNDYNLAAWSQDGGKKKKKKKNSKPGQARDLSLFSDWLQILRSQIAIPHITDIYPNRCVLSLWETLVIVHVCVCEGVGYTIISMPSSVSI